MKIPVIGGGAWGTALAAHFARAGHEGPLWMREPEAAADVNTNHRNEAFLPGVALPEGLRAETDLVTAVAAADAIVVAAPSEFCRKVYRELRPHLAAGVPLVSATKGLELGTLLRMTEVAEQEVPGQPLAVLSGPSFAHEVARGLPTAVVVASRSREVAETIQKAAASRTFRTYSSDDVVGVELGGSLKNVVAIAAGIVSGLGYGHNTVAALVTRGLAEMTRLAVALGGRPDTLAGLAGLGDLVLTTTGSLSRNRRVGEALGSGRSLTDAIAEPHAVAEGVRTTLAACALAEKAGVEMPICFQMKAVLYEGRPPREALDALMLRSLKRE